ncbi:hypothetical protein [Actinomadura vinacea]|uniref:hypothetical protein n=1 Tax=Actinomadura vinacea TaxID=115336 RepID=UPI0031D2F256
MARTRARSSSTPNGLGGFGVAYRPGDPEPDLEMAAVRLRRTVQAACAAPRLPVPRLTVEPGRAIVAHAGITVYRVVSVKHGPAGRLLVAVNGGMRDNPRPSLYGARYAARLIGRRGAGGERTATVVGRHCEAGDVVAPDVRLPADVRPVGARAVHGRLPPLHGLQPQHGPPSAGGRRTGRPRPPHHPPRDHRRPHGPRRRLT